MAETNDTIQIPMTGETMTAGSSFDREMAPVTWERTRLIFIVGLIASAIVFLFNRLYDMLPVTPGMTAWQSPLHLVHPLSFAVGLLIVHHGERTLNKVQGTAFLVVALNLLVVMPAVTVFYPLREPFLPVALLLFVTAAFLPCRMAQVWLAVGAVLVSAVSEFILPALVPAVGDYWVAQGARTAFFEHLWRVTGVALLAGVSVLVSRTLYRLQRSAHQAKRLGNYLIEKELGAGGMGQVFVARHALICRPTAVKVLTNLDGDPSAGIARFEREVQLSASLTHPNTITIFDFGRTSDDTFYYAMEYLEGLDLQRIVEQFGPLPAERVVYLLRQMCGSLGEAHQRGIIHRDIKPSNIFVTQRGGLQDFVKVLDFGLARRVSGAQDSGVTKTGMVFGTPRYIAPESVAGQQKSDARSDLYNVGGVAYWMLTGRPLFAGSSSIDLIIDHVKTIPDRPSQVSEVPIPAELDEIVMKLLEKDPEDRFQTAEELAAALHRVPLEAPWSQERARDWWELHAPEVSVVSASGGTVPPTADKRPRAIAPAVAT
ncbi:MAG: serine/threonine protein kinase [Gemmatimonadota bacterium]|nr:serine/threonine protein kinase [Gemmatimonadota bacterium]